MFLTNAILLLSLLIMLGTAVYLFRDGEGKGPTAGPGIRAGGNAEDEEADAESNPEANSEVRVRMTQVAEDADAKELPTDTEASPDVQLPRAQSARETSDPGQGS